MNEMPKFFVTLKPKARKEHKCCECRGMIPRGEIYFRYKGLWDGCIQTFIRCADCQAMADEMDKDVALFDEIVPFEGLLEACDNFADDKWLIVMGNIMVKRNAEIPDFVKRRVAKEEEQ